MYLLKLTSWALAAWLAGFASPGVAVTPPVTAIVGGTIIDGNGGEPLRNATLLIEGKRIVAVGIASEVAVPRKARVIDAAGKYITPGFIDSNVHISIYNGAEQLLWYEGQFTDIVIEGAQLNLKYGVTTIRDSFGLLPALIQARDAINSGKAIGPRLLVAGNIVGWGGPFSASFSDTQPRTYFQEQMNDYFTQGVGEELAHMTVDQVRVAINAYLDKGPDFIKYGGTVHNHRYSWIGLAPRVQEAIVEETHRRGRPVETHSTSPEALRLSVLAGIDLIQHPETHMVEIPDDLVKLIVDRGVICSVLANKYTGRKWQEVKAKMQGGNGETPTGGEEAAVPQTGWSRSNEQYSNGLALTFRNAQKLIAGGCTVAVSSDSMLPLSPKFTNLTSDRQAAPSTHVAGVGTLRGMEGLVELGMTPMQALVSATRNGALAARGLKDFGTLEVGKLADLVILDADPLADIANVHKQSLVMKEGQLIDRDRLPTNPVLTKQP